MSSDTVSGGEGSSKPQANINKASRQARRAKNGPPSRTPACQACRKNHTGCDLSSKLPNRCTRCEKANIACIPPSANPALPKPDLNRPTSGPLPGFATLTNPRPSAPQQPAAPPRVSSIPAPRPSASQQPKGPVVGTFAPPKMSGPVRTPDEQARFDERNRFDNSDSESDHYGPAPTDHEIQLSLRGLWASGERNRAAQPDVEPIPVVLPESTGGPDAPLLPSTATLLTPVQLAAQEATGGSKKKRRRPKKKSKATATTDSGAPTPSTSEPSTAPTSFQSATVEDEDADPELDIEKHYQDQPFLLCCSSITVTSPISDDIHGDLMDLAQRMAGMIPDHLVIGPKVAYGVVWCDYPVIFALAYHHKPSDERGVNWYGTTSFQSGDITEIIYQAPEIVSYIEAPAIEKECLVRQPHSIDFACSLHLDHTFTLIEVQWQAQGEGKRREAIRKICKATGEDFATFLRADRIEKQHMHL
ncbi:hypothetical protein VTL71DRAFT_1995 [Oculimacula yallundae]|uniref:Zn(2)-C6 fungal-type domain-containing protein n=1 Tax=Oculimacula yallundae TaxID=86028 RepID=A0ABR4CCT4_9HELO